MAQELGKKPTDSGTHTDHAHDPIAGEVMRRLREAQLFKQTDMIGGKSVEQVLVNSYNQYHAIFDPCDMELVKASGVDAYPSITKKKCLVLSSFMRDLILHDTQKLLNLRHTPIPELSKAGRLRAVAKFRGALTQSVGLPPEQLEVVARQIKGAQMQEELSIAAKEVSRQQQIIADQWTETDFVDQYMKFIHHLSIDPYAGMIGPVRRGEHVMQWSGNAMREKYVENDYVHAFDPRDHFYAPDACGKGTGMYEIVQTKFSKAALQRNMNMPGWIKQNINAVITNQARNAELIRLSGGRETDKHFALTQTSADSLIGSRHYGKFTGAQLQPYGISVDKDMLYETVAIVIDGRTIRLEVNVDPTKQRRRVYTTSYVNEPDRIPGSGIAQLCRDTERMFLAAVRNLIQNMGYSSAPMGEVDYTRIARYMAPGAIGSALAGTVMPVDPDASGGGRPAHYFHNVPSQVGNISGLMDKFDRMADEFTGLPAALSGTPIGTGANRTFRGMINLQGNAMKIIQSAFMNIDRDVFHPLIETYHYVNREKHKFQGDPKVDGSGVSGLLQKELKKQAASENLQVVAQIASGAPDTLPSGVMPHVVGEMLRSTGIPDYAIDTPTLSATPEQQPPV